MARKKNDFNKEMESYTPEQLEKQKQAAKQHYINNEGIVGIKVLSRVAKVPPKYITEWIKTENWKGLVLEDPEDLVKLTDDTIQVLEKGAEHFGLTEQEELFCYHYMKTFNATTSAIKAGYSPQYAHSKSYELLKLDKIKDFITHVKGQRNQELFLEPMRIIQEYMRIAFADITDFVKFGPDGVFAKKSSTVDGQLITKIKQGRDGIAIELADKMKALDKLEQYMDVMPEDWKQLLEEEKLQIMREKLEFEKQKDSGDKPINIMITRKGED